MKCQSLFSGKYFINLLSAELAQRVLMVNHAVYCAFDNFQKVIFCLALYTEEINLQNFVMISCKTLCHNYVQENLFQLFV